jgi:hypothetical protein
VESARLIAIRLVPVLQRGLSVLDAYSSLIPFGYLLPVAAQKLTPAESLTATITMEGLLFAAFAVGTKLTEPTKRGRNPIFVLGWFGYSVVGALYLIAAAAAVGWIEVFGVGAPSSPGEFLLALGLAIGIVSQPIFATVINYQLAKG